MSEFLVLVDENDKQIGIEEKIKAHKNRLLHRAFSIIVYNSNSQILVQRRASKKYHSPNLWANSCCGHPRPGERIEDAASRRIYEEMGFSCGMRKISNVLYNLDLGGNMYEKEYVHIFSGLYDGPININFDEVSMYKWVELDFLKNDIINNKLKYASWFYFYFLNCYNTVFKN